MNGHGTRVTSNRWSYLALWGKIVSSIGSVASVNNDVLSRMDELPCEDRHATGTVGSESASFR